MDSMRCGGRQREIKVVGGAMPLAACCSVMLLGGEGGVMLPREDDSVMPLRCGSGAMPLCAMAVV